MKGWWLLEPHCFLSTNDAKEWNDGKDVET